MKDENVIIKFVYTVFLGGLLAVFVGLGVNTFYPAPKYPEYPTQPYYSGNGEVTKTDQKLQDQYDKDYKQYNLDQKEYSKKASIAVLPISVLLLAISLVSIKKIRVITDGIMLGGLFLLMYSLILGLMSGSSKYTFIAASVGVVASLALGYHRFVRTDKKPK